MPPKPVKPSSVTRSQTRHLREREDNEQRESGQNGSHAHERDHSLVEDGHHVDLDPDSVAPPNQEARISSDDVAQEQGSSESTADSDDQGTEEANNGPPSPLLSPVIQAEELQEAVAAAQQQQQRAYYVMSELVVRDMIDVDKLTQEQRRRWVRQWNRPPLYANRGIQEQFN